MNKYHKLIQELDEKGEGYMTCFGNSMLPILKSGSTLKFQKQEEYHKGDIVFCKVNGRFIDAHKIVKTSKTKGFLIANNHGFENGWTKKIFGKAVEASHKGETKKL